MCVYHSHLSSRCSSTVLSIKAWRGNRWWKDLARCGANTRVKPWRQHVTHKQSTSWCFCGLERKVLLITEQRILQRQTHRLNGPIRRTTNFTLHRKLCVFGVALWTKVSSQRQTGPTAAVQMSRRQTAGETQDDKKSFWHTYRLFTKSILTPCWMKAWRPGPWERRWCAEENLNRTTGFHLHGADTDIQSVLIQEYVVVSMETQANLCDVDTVIMWSVGRRKYFHTMREPCGRLQCLFRDFYNDESEIL